MHDRYVYFRSVQIKLPPSATQKRGKRRVRAPKHVFARIMVVLFFSRLSLLLHSEHTKN